MRRDRRGSFSLAEFDASFAVAAIDLKHLARYRQFFGDSGRHIPLAYFYLLAQRAQVALMLDSRFSYPIPGLIHASNQLRLYQTPQAGRCMTALVSVRPGQDTAASRKVFFTVEITQFGRRMITCVSEYRARRTDHEKVTRKPRLAELPEALSESAWLLKPHIFRRYARLSGDFNPIHLSALAAKAFGLRAAIAHGMYSVGRSAVAIEKLTGRQVIALDAHFKSPILLPSQVNFGFKKCTEDDAVYVISSSDKQLIHIEGICTLS